MKRSLGKVASIFIVLAGWLLAGVLTVLDLIGYATIPEDVQVASGLLRDLFLWILSLPWWVPWGFALIATLWLIRVSWPRVRADEAPPTVASSKSAETIRAQAKLVQERPLAKLEEAVQRYQEDDSFSPDKQRQLIKELKQYSETPANVKITFANVKHKKLAEILISIFELAGWQTNLTNVPLEHYLHQYIEGIEVRGYNKHFVESICEALNKSGLQGIRADVRSSEVSKENPKWQRVQHYLRITIGH